MQATHLNEHIANANHGGSDSSRLQAVLMAAPLTNLENLLLAPAGSEDARESLIRRADTVTQLLDEILEHDHRPLSRYGINE